MKIINRTLLRKSLLRKIAIDIARREFDEAINYKRISVRFLRRARGAGLSGYAYFGMKTRNINGKFEWSGSVTVNLPHHKYGIAAADLCVVLAHELKHVREGKGGRSWEIANRRDSARYGWGSASKGTWGAYRQYYAWATEKYQALIDAAEKEEKIKIQRQKRKVKRIDHRPIFMAF